MPRFYNPEDSDFTIWFAKKFYNFFQSKINTLNDDEIEKAIKSFK